jgi:two-component system chemotaxis response regulator CheB
VDKARHLEPAVITMDVRMPRLDGLGAIAAIMAHVPTRILVVCDTSKESEMDLSFRAVSAGALELIPKPRPGQPLREWGKRLVDSLLLMADVPVVRRRSPSVPKLEDLRPPERSGSIDVFGLVASTGGPPALASLLGTLPANYPVPIVIAQHMAPGFAKGLATWLDGCSRLRVVLAEDRTRLEPGCVYLPHDGDDVMVDHEGQVRTPPAEGPHCPWGDRLLQSLARAYGPRSAGVVLTGMGDDGAAGLLSIREAGGYTMAQDQASSVVYGMPAAAMARGAASLELSLDHIAIKMIQMATMRPNADR